MAREWVPRVVVAIALVALTASPALAQQEETQAAASLSAPDRAPDVTSELPPITSAPAPSSGFTPWPFGVVLTGVGATGIVSGLLIGLTALLQSDDARNPSLGVGCVDSRCTPFAFATVKQAHDLAEVADAVLFTGIGFAVVGTILMFALGDYGGTSASAACDANGCQAAVRGVF